MSYNMDGNCFTQTKNNVQYKIILSDPDTLQCHMTEAGGETAADVLNMDTATASSKASTGNVRQSRLVAPRKHRKLPAPPPPSSAPLMNGSDSNVSDTKSKGVYVVDCQTAEHSDAQVAPAVDETTQANAPPPRPPKPQFPPHNNSGNTTSSNAPSPATSSALPAPARKRLHPRHRMQRPAIVHDILARHSQTVTPGPG